MDSKNHFTPGRSHTVSNPPSVLTSTATFVIPSCIAWRARPSRGSEAARYQRSAVELCSKDARIPEPANKVEMEPG